MSTSSPDSSSSASRDHDAQVRDQRPGFAVAPRTYDIELGDGDRLALPLATARPVHDPILMAKLRAALHRSLQRGPDPATAPSPEQPDPESTRSAISDSGIMIASPSLPPPNAKPFDFEAFQDVRRKARALDLTADKMRDGLETAIEHMPTIVQILACGSEGRVYEQARKHAEDFLPEGHQLQQYGRSNIRDLGDPNLVASWREAAEKLTDERLCKLAFIRAGANIRL